MLCQFCHRGSGHITRCFKIQSVNNMKKKISTFCSFKWFYLGNMWLTFGLLLHWRSCSHVHTHIINNVCVCVSVQWETAMTSSTGGGGTSSGERGATWSGRERERRGGGTTGPTGELTWTHLNTSVWHVVTDVFNFSRQFGWDVSPARTLHAVPPFSSLQ